MPGSLGDIVNKMVKGQKARKYDPEVRAFSLTLNFYSPKAYSFVREHFNNYLPHPSTLSKWYRSVNGTPGFTQEAIHALSVKIKEAEAKGHNVICNLVYDEMSIRKCIEWTGKITTGYVDIGANVSSDLLPVATEAIVFMLVAVNGHWKIPVGYFLVNGLAAPEKANLVNKCLEFVHQPGLIISSLTFDGTATNLRTCRILGANFDTRNMESYFMHPKTKKRVHIFLDPPHMLKLVRNCFGECRVLTTPEGKEIKWSYIEKLAEIHACQGLEAANKLKQRHIKWHNEKMKVKLAAQTLSKSVADALLFLCHDLKLSEFKGAEETAKFIQLFNDLFDVLNSRSLISSYLYKRPLSPASKIAFFSLMDRAVTFINNSFLNGIPLLKSKRKTGFLGFLICVNSLKNYYYEYIENTSPLLKYIISYKFSQDHLEMFFSIIRSKGGFNNNPTARQFEATYRKLLIHAEIKGSIYANATPLDSTSVLQCTSRCTVTGSANELCSVTNITELHLDDHTYISPTSLNLSEYLIDIIGYIAGFVVKSIKPHVICADCIQLLETDISLSQLQKRKEYGNLVRASLYVHTVCQTAEKTIRYYKILSNITSIKNIYYILIKDALTRLSSSVFDVFKNHEFEGDVFNGHFLILTKLILSTYFRIRLHKECKDVHQNVSRIRSKCTKYILFSNQ